ncbi:MAG: phenylacetic acid degradation protein [Alphaproteobacteria bacterium HGW-Alphaproteobacteria-2]|nr:MAG: phenylacetic acid degradation protein [Alphaproteobacteria bacterium HGW-Alphaproteobacteria-2]
MARYSRIMTARAPFPADAMIAALAELGEMRVWSLVITIFGDSVRPRGGVAPARALGAVAGRIGIQPGALRVALHRLAQDGWILRSRQGRLSYCRLSPRGEAEFGPAAARIYAPAPELSGPWRLAAAAPGPAAGRDAEAQAMARAGWIALGPGLWLGPAQAGAASADVALVEGRLVRLPGWARAQIVGPDLCAEYAALVRALGRVEAAFAGAELPDPLDAVALRTLMIHHWRRLLLRHPDLPADILPEGWQGETCRARVLALHRALSGPADRWLDAALAGQETPEAD